jgi:hypothetical protein
MHRSGTSVITRLLGNLGFFIGADADLLPPNEGNEEGYWERIDVVDLNKSLLQHNDADWTAPQDYRPDRLGVDDLNAFRNAAKDIVDPLMGHQPFVLKDPRLCITIDEWLPVLGDVVFVVCIRHPLDVAQSLEKRNGLTLSVALALWEYYNTNIAKTVENRPHITVDYADLVSDPPAVSSRVANALRGLGLTAIPDELTDSHYGHITPHTRHERVQKKTLVAQLSAQQIRIYRQIADNRIRTLRVSELDVTAAKSILDLLKRSKKLGQVIEANRTANNARLDKQIATVDKLSVLLSKHKESLERMRR